MSPAFTFDLKTNLWIVMMFIDPINLNYFYLKSWLFAVVNLENDVCISRLDENTLEKVFEDI